MNSENLINEPQMPTKDELKKAFVSDDQGRFEELLRGWLVQKDIERNQAENPFDSISRILPIIESGWVLLHFGLVAEARRAYEDAKIVIDNEIQSKKPELLTSKELEFILDSNDLHYEILDAENKIASSGSNISTTG
jgi:hypothetical protein